ncbi:MAG: DUF4142 domain-containing protein [Pseudonocardiaceae bacterium]
MIVPLTAAVFQYWVTSQDGTANVHSTAQDTGWTQTRWGPLGPADRDLLVMVRQADLSGGSSGRAAQRQAGSVQVRTAAKRTGVVYGDLDVLVRSVAGKLGVPLPDQPTAQQQSWMSELSGRSGPDFDRMFAQRLRVTDGAMLPAITSVRAGTRNELIRSFAASASVLVNRDMEALESTGLVDYSRLAEPLPPAAAVTSPPARIPPAGPERHGPEQHIDQVVEATPSPPPGPLSGSGVHAMATALVSIAALLAALGLLGATGRRVRQVATPRHRGDPHRGLSRRPPHSRHAAQRW